MDFLIWIDLKNTIGVNKIATIIGPILNVCQPLILYIIKLVYYKPVLNNIKTIDFLVLLLNILYLIYFVTIYTKFLNTNKLITGTKNGHLHWPWIKYSNPYFYLILFAINIFYLFTFTYALLLFIILYLFLLLSVKYFYYSAGELWCFFGAFIPLIMFFVSFYL